MPAEADQIHTIGMMAAHESAVADLYRAYSRRFPERSEFFEALAEDEVRHARMIAGFADDVKARKVQVNPERFSSQMVLSSLDLVRKRVTEAGQGRITLLDALTAAQDVEHELIEQRYFEIAEGDAPELKGLLETLAAETDEHRQRVVEAWREAQQT